MCIEITNFAKHVHTTHGWFCNAMLLVKEKHFLSAQGEMGDIKLKSFNLKWHFQRHTS